jgi:hypothetical protein
MERVRAHRFLFQTMTPPSPNPCEPSRCPLCGNPNDCQLCAASPYKGPCWCFTVEIPQSLLDKVPVEARRKTCICRKCIEAAT